MATLARLRLLLHRTISQCRLDVPNLYSNVFWIMSELKPAPNLPKLNIRFQVCFMSAVWTPKALRLFAPKVTGLYLALIQL